MKERSFRFTSLDGEMVHEITCINKYDHKYLETEADGGEPNILPSLPGCR